MRGFQSSHADKSQDVVQILAGIGGLAVACVVCGCAALTGPPDLDTPDGQIYARRCGSCHGVPDLRFRTVSEWNAVMAGMDDKLQAKKRPPLTEHERAAILRYLRAHTKASETSGDGLLGQII